MEEWQEFRLLGLQRQIEQLESRQGTPDDTLSTYDVLRLVSELTAILLKE